MRGAAAALLLLALVAGEARAQELEWKSSFRRADELDLIVAGALAASLAGAQLALRTRDDGIRGGVLFDDAARNLFRNIDEDSRQRAHDASTIAQNVLVAFPFVVDSLALALAYRENTDVALHTALINTQSFLVTAGVTVLTKNLASRERPYAITCDEGSSCGGRARNKSFISGHAAASFTAAGLVCAHHENLELFGDAWADRLACGSVLTAAAVTSMLRIAADEHYATDVLAGAAVGILSGYFLPKLIYYAGFDDDE